jgi:hypothetical protein
VQTADHLFFTMKQTSSPKGASACVPREQTGESGGTDPSRRVKDLRCFRDISDRVDNLKVVARVIAKN